MIATTSFTYGWVCPKCESVYAPATRECFKCNVPTEKSYVAPRPSEIRATYAFGGGGEGPDQIGRGPTTKPPDFTVGEKVAARLAVNLPFFPGVVHLVRPSNGTWIVDVDDGKQVYQVDPHLIKKEKDLKV